MQTRILYCLALPVIATLGCAGPHFPLPMTAAELARYPPGPALTAYLGQRDASPTVCDLGARGPHLAAVDENARAALVGALTGGEVEPEIWRRCASAVLRSAPRADAAALIDAIGHDYRSLIKSSDFEKSPALQDRVRAMQRLYVERRHRPDGDVVVSGDLIADLHRALVGRRLGPAGAALGQDLVVTVDLEHGLWRGRPVDVAMIDGLFAGRDEKTLRRFANRLPAPALRDEARRRVVRIHIAASPYPEVRRDAAAVEDVVMKRGAYVLPLAGHPPTRGWLDAAKLPLRGVLVRQAVWRQTAKLLGYAGDQVGVSVLPEVKLRGALLMEVPGISRPVTLCAPARELDPTPCVASEDVKLDNPAAYLDKGGAFRFVDDISMRDAVSLVSGRDKFELPVSVAGRRLLSFQWRLFYERPEPLLFTGPQPGTVGPDLRVVADRRDPSRFVFTVTGVAGTYLAVVEAIDAPAYRISSRGAQGFTGASGTSGSSGMDGGECEDGEDGEDGGDGGHGGPGGDGGTVTAQVLGGDTPCPETLALLSRVILSEAGPGGAGGPGGDGGRGGDGGSGRSPSDDDSGCSAGSDGHSGSDGSSGPAGPPGHPGRVIIEMGR